MAAAGRRIKRLEKVDRAAVTIITLGGIAVVVSVIGILVFIAAEAVPLFRSASATSRGAVRLEGRAPAAGPAALGVDESGRYVYDVAADGSLAFYRSTDGQRTQSAAPESIKGAVVTSASRSLTGDSVALGTADGRVALMQVAFTPEYEGSSVKDVKIQVSERGMVQIGAGQPVRRVSYAQDGDRRIVAGQIADDAVAMSWTDGDENREEFLRVPAGKVTALAAGQTGTVIAGTDGGKVYRWELGEHAMLTDVSNVSAEPVTALSYLVGARTFVAGTRDGHVSAWFRAPVGADESLGMVRAHEFESQGTAIVSISASSRDRTFATADATGGIVVRHQTSGRTLLTIRHDQPVNQVVITPRGDGMLARTADGVARFSLANPHPEISWHTLFGKVWYEGYAQPEYVWQSTGSTDEFEPKLSLVPLVFGTIKGTVYALIFAIPIAVLGALYTSLFVHPSFRAKIKPTIEIMAALPSVVIGFVAGLYLAPTIERNLVAVGLLMVVLPVLGTSGLLVWNSLPHGVRQKLKVGAELFIIVPMLVLGVWLAFAIAPAVEVAFFGGDARQWLATVLGINYDQRNSLVVGLAMGFAVIPIIFTISEDAFSSVPSNLSAASLALGASRWQTAVRVVVPTASPGVFSAIMVGFGRAVGETMIVLMATGNTPLLDWSIFNGFRTLSANIAVEIGEAPQGGSLYRTLFLSAALLFLMTFTLNTLAEIIRQRLRERYKAV
jgi:phosphate transport system permease protein